jgi:hypothetical protein
MNPPSYNDLREAWEEDDFMDCDDPVKYYANLAYDEDWLPEDWNDDGDYEKDIERLASNYLID